MLNFISRLHSVTILDSNMPFYTATTARALTTLAATIGLLVLLFIPSSVQAQSEEEEAVVAAVQHLFDAMAVRDTLAARAVLLPEGRFYSIRDTDDGPRVGSSTHREFLDQLSTPGADWLERLWNPTVLIHGRMAVVWAEYDFHRDGAFSHCGVDAFSLFKTADGWKIAGTTYTVEPTGCEESPLGPPK